ncbi:hypothetical protein [Brumimicrobium mesophilum]|uniref:hypothetical protein n=1 Tax=Brumimicrobium mesophilum TaxID=392717 RepID=UPI000D143679|nr:hypothetical protein [Brumimicrobium mesophilum]
MSWTKFRLNKIALISIVFLTFTSCNNNEGSTDIKESVKKKEVETFTEEEKIIRQVESVLGISATETYDIDIQYKFIDQDTLKDALILVNRREFAFQKAKNTDTERFFKETGNTGLYNYIFLLKGGEQRIISTNPVGSNANYPLKVEFLELTSKAHKDFYVEFRVRNSLHRNYYTVRNNRIYLTFSCPVFDKIGESEPLVYDIKHQTSSVRIAKDIALFKGQIVGYNPKNIDDINEFQPEEVTNNGELFVYFIFNEKTMKYVTPMPAMEK